MTSPEAWPIWMLYLPCCTTLPSPATMTLPLTLPPMATERFPIACTPRSICQAASARAVARQRADMGAGSQA